MSGPLELVRCANPACSGIGHGGPRLLARCRLVPGAVVEPVKCKSCGWITRVTVARDGEVLIHARPWKKAG